MPINARVIAKNTLFLYFRFLLILVVTFYVSRVLLSKLGVEDYGLYNVVFSVIGIISFINTTLSSSTSRFITYELGKNEKDTLILTFSTAFYAHLLLALFIVLLAETVGLWYINNKLVVPPDRLFAAQIVYQTSVLITVVSIIRVPFMSSIIAHEKMNAYAYIGIIDALTRFVAAYVISYYGGDKLVFYAIMLLVAQVVVSLLYVLYSRFNFLESRFSIRHDNKILIGILKFSGWSILANMSNTLSIQGVILLFNLFFSPVVVAAQAISNQISNAIAQLVQNVKTAVNPQIIKLYADGSHKESEKLTLLSSEYVFYLLMIVGFPVILVMPMLMDIWLEEVPDYTVIFARFLVFQLIVGNFNDSYYYPLLAANKISLNSVLEGLFCLFQFVILYLLFKVGLGPMWARYIGLVIVCLFSFLEKPLILWKFVGYDLREMYGTMLRCVLVMVVAVILNIPFYLFLPQDTIVQNLIICIFSAIAVTLSCLVFMPKENRKKLIAIVIKRRS